MKREEMVQLIFEKLLVMFPDQRALESRAESILEIIEGAGMQPPRIEVKHGFLGDEYGYTNEWE